MKEKKEHISLNKTEQDVERTVLSSRQLLPTTRTKRFFNYVIDYIVLYLLSFTFGYIFGWLVGVVVVVLYYAVSESIWSKTPAKFITKTKVVMEDGKKPEYGTIFTRTLIRFVPFDAFSFLSFKRPMGWHDKWSKTIVVDDNAKKKIGWYNEAPDNFLCVSCFTKTKNINQKDYKPIGENSLEDDIYTCDECKRVFD